MKTLRLASSSILVAFLLGATLSLLPIPIPSIIPQTIAELFIRLLKFMALPIIFLSILSTLTNLKSVKSAGRLLRRILTYTILTTTISALIGLILFCLINPSSSQEPSIPGATPQQGAAYLDFIKDLFPVNFVDPFLKGNVLSVAVMAAVFGLAISKIDTKASKQLTEIIQALFKLLLKVTTWILKLLPLGVFAFTFELISSFKTNSAHISSLLLYSATVILANLIQGLVVLPIFLKRNGVSPKRLFKAMYPALLTAFYTKSSTAAFPVALDRATNHAKISKETSTFSFPLCSVINMNGCAAFILITSLFVMTSYNVELSLFQMLLWVLISTLAAIGNAGIPMGCYFLTSGLILSMNLPLTLLGLILPLYSIFDMIETALNVWSDCCITAVVDKKQTQQLPINQTV